MKNWSKLLTSYPQGSESFASISLTLCGMDNSSRILTDYPQGSSQIVNWFDQSNTSTVDCMENEILLDKAEQKSYIL